MGITVRSSSRIPQLVAQVTARSALIIAKAAMDIQGHAQQGAPVRTGFLKGSIQAKQEKPLAWRVDVQAEYGIYVEFGTSRMAARPYFVPAVELVRPSFIQAMAQVIP